MTWNDRIREAREAAGLSRLDIARRAHLSAASIESYELGRRQPTRPTLIRLCQALNLEDAATTAVLTAAGFEPLPPPALAALAARRVDLPDLRETTASYPWPCLVMNERHEILYWNAAAVTVAELDFGRELPLPRQRNLMLISAMKHFRERVENWDAVVAVLMSILKGDKVDFYQPNAQSQYYMTLVEQILRDHADAATPLLTLWQNTPPRQTGGRIHFPVLWRTGDGTRLRFNALLGTWNDFDAAWSFDWHPADAATWAWVERRSSDSVAPSSSSNDGLGSADAQSTPTVEQPWNVLLQQAREATGVTQDDLAATAGLSRHTLASYETARRRPSRTALVRLSTAMVLDGATTNAILTAAGFEPEPSDWSLFLAGLLPRGRIGQYEGREYTHRSPAEVQRDIDTHLWPCLIIGSRYEIVCWNRPISSVLGLSKPQAWPDGWHENVIRLFLSAAFRGHVPDWGTVISAIMPGVIQQLVGGTGGRVPRHLRDAVMALQADPLLLARLRELWSETSFETATSRLAVPVTWLADDGATLTFNCVISRWNPYDPYWVMDWHPADVETWLWLGRAQGQNS